MPIHTTPNPDGNGWINQSDNSTTSAHETKEDAVEAGRELARRERTEHVIHNTDGTIAQSNSYGNDPLPPRDQR